MRRRDVLVAAALSAVPHLARADAASDALIRAPDRVVMATFPALTKEGRYGPMLAALDKLGPVASDTGGQSWAILGEEEKALDAWDRQRHPSVQGAKAVAEASAQMARLVDAVEAIAVAAQGKRVVILNEDHNRSRHRAFTGLVLARLRRDGFDLFAAEAFSELADTLKPGDPVLPGLGLYTCDPVYAETVREALALGYALANYDFAPPGGRFDFTHREHDQANNLMAALSARPGSRAVVHSGEGHGLRTELGQGVPSFGLNLNALLGERALMVDQLRNAPLLRPAQDRPLLQAARAHGLGRTPVVARDAAGRVLTGADGDMVDLSVISPRLLPVDGRPGWIFERPGRVSMSVDLPKTVPRCLVQAVPTGELAHSPLAVPADQIVIAAGQRQAQLSLRPGRYRLRLETASGRTDLRDFAASQENSLQG